MKAIKFIILSVLAASIVVGCGGGGGGSTPAQSSTSTVYTLPNPENIIPTGSSLTFNLSGKDNQGHTITGNLSIANKGLVTVSGTSYLEYDELLSLMTNVGASYTATTNIYLDPTTNNPVYEYSPTSGLTYTAVTVNVEPTTAQINNFGSLTTYSISNGGSETGSWQLKTNTSPYADLVESFVFKDNVGTITDTEDDTYTIDPSGTIQLLTVHLYEPGTGYTIDISGKPV